MIPSSSSPRVFGVDYQFLSCGDVFTQGLVHAAPALGVTYDHALWNDEALVAKVQAFAPDLLFVVHGRRFVQRFGNVQGFGVPSAIWLLDEPYEVDDTVQTAREFDYIFVNDAATIHRHRAATYLPVCYDPIVHRPPVDAHRTYAVGFIGGGNAQRDRILGALARAGQLSYTVGGAWSDPDVARFCLAPNIPATATAHLYQTTQIVINIWRAQHHFNREGIPATAMNPRCYEAPACGALVVSEWRPELDTVVPEMPAFETPEQCVDLVRTLRADPDLAESLRAACADRLRPHTYASRLWSVLSACGLEIGVQA